MSNIEIGKRVRVLTNGLPAFRGRHNEGAVVTVIGKDDCAEDAWQLEGFSGTPYFEGQLQVVRLSDVTRLGILNLISFIAIHPNMVEMNTWVGFNPEKRELLADKKNFSCGSVGCIAGLQTALQSPVGLTPEYIQELNDKHYYERTTTPGVPIFFGGVALEAKHSLDLTVEQSVMLFVPSNWPEDLREELNEFDSVSSGDDVYQLRDELTAFRYAQLIIRRLQLFLDSEGTK